MSAKPSETTKVNTGHGNLYVTLVKDPDGNVSEVFATLGKSGGCERAAIEAIGRLVALNLRNGVPMIAIIEQLRGLICHPIYHESTSIGSPADAIAYVLKEYNDGVQVPGDTSEV